MLVTFLTACAALALGCALGWGACHLRRLTDVRLQAGHALAARVAVARSIPLLERVDSLLDLTRGGGLMSPTERDELDRLPGEALHLLRALTWGSGRYYRHDGRGTYYEVLTYHLGLQTSGAPPVADGDEMVLYVDVRSGRVSCRHPVEFHDGRFTRVTRDEALDAAEGAADGGYVDQDRDLLRRMPG